MTTFKEKANFYIGCKVMTMADSEDGFGEITVNKGDIGTLTLINIGNIPIHMDEEYEPWSWGIEFNNFHIATWARSTDFKPILIPMDKMSEADGLNLIKFVELADYHSTLNIINQNIYFIDYKLIEGIQSKRLIFDTLSPKQFQFLLSKHYNIFNLPSEEFIDATSLNPNPYK
jgi:hypothetical protein